MKKTFQVKEVWIHIIVWVCLISFPLAVTFKEFGRVPSFLFPRILLNPILVYVNYLILVPQLLVKRKIVQYISLSILTLVLFIFLMNYFIPAQPFNNNMVELKKMAEMPPFKALSYMMTTMVSLAFFLLGGLLGLTKYYYKREKVTSKKEVQRQETELQFLRAQLNPHFLFNSLNSIYSLVRNKSNDAPEAVITLSELMRYMLYEAKRELVPLIKEIHTNARPAAPQPLRRLTRAHPRTARRPRVGPALVLPSSA
ncbi:MAG: histidine kinase [Bacteroidota bacterium]